jgi:beta-lactamase regulating signal transducer with metallopeptidase domain/Tfp pilus assembly protein PilF
MTLQGLREALVLFVGEHALAGRLLLTSLEFAVLALAVAAVIFVFRLRQPRLRALLWLMVLAKPLVGLVLGTPLPLLLLTPPAPVVVNAAPEPLAEPVRPQLWSAIHDALGDPVAEPAPPIDYAALALEGALGLWLAGCAVMALRLAMGQWRLRRMIREAAAPSPWLEERLAQAARALKLGEDARLPRLRVTAALESPALAGFWRPVILVPAWLSAEADPLQVDWSLRHELMHWRLRDPLASLLRELARLVFFFHPAAWWAGRKWQEATEMACDRALIHSMEDAEMYVQELYRMLLKVRAQRRVPVAGGLFAGRTQISQRIASLVQDPLRAPARLSAGAVTLVVLLSIASLSVGVGVKSQAAEEKPSGAPTSQTVTAKPAPGTKNQPINLFDLIHGNSMSFDEDKGTMQIDGDGIAMVKLGASEIWVMGDQLVTSASKGGSVAMGIAHRAGTDPLGSLLTQVGKNVDGKKSSRHWVTAGKALIQKGKIILTGNAVIVSRDGHQLLHQSAETLILTPEAKTGDLHIESSPEKYPLEVPPFRPMKVQSARNNKPWYPLTWHDVKLEPMDPAKPENGAKLVLTASGANAKGMAPIEVTAKTAEREPGKKSIMLKGAVRISDGKTLQATSEELVCTEQGGHVVLTLIGNPEVIQERGKEPNGKKTKTRAQAGKIVIDPSGDGMPRVSLLQPPGSKRMPKIEVVGAGKMINGAKATSATTEMKPGSVQQPAVSEADKLAAEEQAATGWRLWRQGKLPEAEAAFKKALEKNPNEANTWNGLGWTQFNQGKPLNAKKSFEECLKRDPKQAAALNGLGWIAKGAGKPDEAIGYWKRAVAAVPEATAALAGLARTYMEQKNYKEAERVFEQWLKAEPNSEEAKEGLEKAKAGAAGKPLAFSEANLKKWIARLDDPKAPPFEALNVIIRMGPEAVPGLIDAMKTNDNWQVPKALGAIGDKRAAAPLIEKLEKNQWSPMKEVVGEALGIITGQKLETKTKGGKVKTQTGVTDKPRVKINIPKDNRTAHKSTYEQLQVTPLDPANPARGVKVIMGDDGGTILAGRVVSRDPAKKEMILDGGVTAKQDDAAGTQVTGTANRVILREIEGWGLAATLEGKASIIKDKIGQKTQAFADVIKIDKGADGTPRVSLIMEDRTRQPKIEVFDKDKTGALKKRELNPTELKQWAEIVKQHNEKNP